MNKNYNFILLLIAIFFASYFSSITYSKYQQQKASELVNRVLSDFDASVLLFSTTTCPYCEKARKILQQNEIVYKELLVDVEQKYDEILINTLQSNDVPVLLINGHDKRV